MIIYNLTDCTPPLKKPRQARSLTLRGVTIEAGKSKEFPNSILVSDISGWLLSNMISIDVLPEWYQVARREARLLAARTPPAKEPEKSGEGAAVPEDGEAEEAPKRKPPKRKKRS